MLVNKKTGPEKNGACWLARIIRPLYFEKNGRRSRAAIINRRACSVFSWPTPQYLFCFFLVGGTNLMHSCYGVGGAGQARPGKGVAEKTAIDSKNGPGWRDAIIAEGSEKKTKNKNGAASRA